MSWFGNDDMSGSAPTDWSGNDTGAFTGYGNTNATATYNPNDYNSNYVAPTAADPTYVRKNYGEYNNGIGEQIGTELGRNLVPVPILSNIAGWLGGKIGQGAEWAFGGLGGGGKSGSYDPVLEAQKADPTLRLTPEVITSIWNAYNQMKASENAQEGAFGNAQGIERDAQGQAIGAYNNATDAQKQYYDQYLSFQQPYMGLGTKAIGDYSKFLTLDPELSPSYQFAKKNFLQELPKSLAPSGLMRSGVRDQLTAQGIQGLLADESNKIYARYLDALKIGQGAANTAGAGSMQTAGNLGNIYGNMANNYTQAGNNQANIALAQGIAKQGLYNTRAQIPFNAMNAYQNYDFMNQMFPKQETKRNSYSTYKPSPWEPQDSYTNDPWSEGGM